MRRHTRTVEDTKQVILQGTFRALVRYGSHELTMEKIAAEIGMSTGILHYHYETKEKLLLSLLDHMIDRFEQALHRWQQEISNPRDQLRAIIQAQLSGPEQRLRDYAKAMADLWSLSLRSDLFRERLVRHQRSLLQAMENIIQRGMRQRQFQVDDAREHALLINALVDGIWHQWSLDRDIPKDKLAQLILDDILTAP